jgi:hypothetical protein
VDQVPEVELSLPLSRVSLCESVKIQVIKSTIDARKGLQNYDWVQISGPLKPEVT